MAEAAIRPPPPATIGMSAPSFTIRHQSGLIASADLRGQWLLVVSLPAGGGRCTDIVTLVQTQAPFRRRHIAVAALVSEPPAGADLIREAAAHHGQPGFLGVISDPDHAVATAFGLVDTAGSMQHASVVIDPEGRVCGIIRHGPSGNRCVDSLLTLFDSLRAGRAGCTAQHQEAHA